MGLSVSKAESIQNAASYITQQNQQSCNVECQNVLSDVNIDIINSRIGGGINITQSCATNANCMFGNAMDAISDVQLKAANSSNASGAWSGWSLNPFNFDISESISQQDIKNSITETSSEKCNVSSYNQMNDVTILAVNSDIQGGINLSQNATAQGSCTLDNSMNAAAYSMGMAQNNASSGGKGKGNIAYLFIAMAVISALGIIAKVIAGRSRGKATRGQLRKIAMARAKACVAQGGRVQVDNKEFPIIGGDGKPLCSLPMKEERIRLDIPGLEGLVGKRSGSKSGNGNGKKGFIPLDDL